LEVGAGQQAADKVLTWLFEEESFAPVGKLVGAQSYGIVSDHLGTPLQMHNQQGEQVWATELNSYGQRCQQEGEARACPFRYQGQYEDVETGLYYNRFRYYDPEVGQYVSQDPIGLLGGIAVYSYVSDPTGWIDEFGLAKKGGSHSSVRAANTGGEVHHTPAFKSYDGLSNVPTHATGPTFHMDQTDHWGTASHGRQGNAGRDYRAEQRRHIQRGRWDKAVEMDINDIQARHGNKYNAEMIEMLDYTKNQGLITDAQHKRLKRKCR
jgi:RHS repeat-associated protein